MPREIRYSRFVRTVDNSAAARHMRETILIPYAEEKYWRNQGELAIQMEMERRLVARLGASWPQRYATRQRRGASCVTSPS